MYGKVVNYACAVVDVCLPRQCCIKTDFLDDAVDRGIIVTVIGSTVEGNLEFGLCLAKYFGAVFHVHVVFGIAGVRLIVFVMHSV